MSSEAVVGVVTIAEQQGVDALCAIIERQRARIAALEKRLATTIARSIPKADICMRCVEHGMSGWQAYHYPHTERECIDCDYKWHSDRFDESGNPIPVEKL